MKHPIAIKCCLPLLLVSLVVFSPNAYCAAGSDQTSGASFFSRLNIFSTTPEERDAKETTLREKADVRSRELAEAIAAAKDADAKERLQKEAADHAAREKLRREAFDKQKAAEQAEAKAKAEAETKKAAERKAAEEAKAKAKAEAETKKAAELKAREEQRVKAEAERKAAEQADAKAKAESKEKAEQERKERKAALKKQVAEQKAAKEAAVQAKKVQAEKEQSERLAALQARLKTAEATRAKSETEAKARAERERKVITDAISKAAAERKAKEEAACKAEQERRAARERDLRARMDERAKELAAAAAAADPKEKELLQKDASLFTERETARRAAFDARESEFKSRWEARSKALDEHEKRQLEKALSSTDEMPNWTLSAGLIYRTINSQTFKTDSYSRNYDIAAKSRRSSSSSSSSSVGNLNETADREYIDGYVRKDSWTDLDGGTWNWGYENGSQVQGDQLVLNWIGEERTEFTRDTKDLCCETDRDSDGNSGIYLRAERAMARAGELDIGLRLDASRVAFSAFGTASTFNDSQNWATYCQYNQDTFSLEGTDISSESDPYRGTHESSEITIHNRPVSRQYGRTSKVSSGSYEAYNSVYQSLDLDLYTISLGMSLSANYQRLFLSGSLGPTLTLADTDASYQETLFHRNNGGASSILASWNESRKNTEYNLGLYVQGELGLRLIKGFALSVFGRYDWIENISGNVGQTRYEVNPEGGSVGGALNYSF